MKILLAEDDFVTRKFMASFLSKYGECDVTVDGMEAVDAFMLALEEGEPYDLVCLDIMMPVMDGYQALMGIRKLEKEKKRQKQKEKQSKNAPEKDNVTKLSKNIKTTPRISANKTVTKISTVTKKTKRK